MQNNFEVLSFLVAEFVSQDSQGRWNFVGVYTNGMEFAQFLPEYLPSLNLVIIISPKQQDFKIVIKIKSPNGNEIFNYSTDINGNMLPPPEARFVWALQLPQNILFDGIGYYSIDISDGDEKNSVRQLLPVNVQANISGGATTG